MTLLACPRRDCAHLNAETASECEECGKGLFPRGNVYINLYRPDNPVASPKGYVGAHRLVAAQKVGRLLGPDEVVHHINGVKSDNRPENLYVCANAAEHNRIHWALRRKTAEQEVAAGYYDTLAGV